MNYFDDPEEWQSEVRNSKKDMQAELEDYEQ